MGYDFVPGDRICPVAAVWTELSEIDARTADLLETEAKYAVYLDHQLQDIADFKAEEATPIATDVDFSSLPGLSNELKESSLHEIHPR